MPEYNQRYINFKKLNDTRRKKRKTEIGVTWKIIYFLPF